MKQKRTDVPTHIVLPEKEMPRQWYNVIADMSDKPLPSLNSKGQPLTPPDLADIFPMSLIAQEASESRFVDIPDEVFDLYKLYRPSPLFRAYRLERALSTPARIYYKYEGGNTSGSHKLNTAIPQVYYNKADGISRITTETGAGQWGTAVSMACGFFGLECLVYMVKASYEQKPYRRIIMETYGAKVIPSPSPFTAAGRAVLAKDPDCLGSLGVAISEAVEDAASRKDTNYALGSVLDHVILHQTVIGQEAKKQMEMIDESPDIVIACCGGGSNFGGLVFPLISEKLRGKPDKTRYIAVEPAACPTLTLGKYAYDYGDTAKLTPLMMQYTLGHSFMPPGIHSGGLRYHGASSLVSKLYHDGFIEARAVKQLGVFEAAVMFARNEGILPAPESSHAIRAAIDEALACKESGEEKVILFGLSGHGHFDMTAYDNYMHEQVLDYEYSREMVEKGLDCLPKI